ncbi:MAG: metallophosphoesterase [Gemmatimonadaceae bacterium]|nr:metallophosphoesterase [Gemmatimonadaceae bacterium]
MRVGALSVFALVLWSGLRAPSSPLVDATISGHVYVDRNGNGLYDAGERGLRGVAVSNQDQVVVSDADGAFHLPGPGSTGVVFVSVPNGYTSRGTFYRTIDSSASNRGPIDFAMAPAPVMQTLTFIHSSDTHIADASLPRTKRLRALIDSIRPAFVIISGDLVRDALRVGEAEATGYYELFQREMALVRPPVWTIPGNHEAFGIERDKSGVKSDHPLYGRVMYRHYRGPDYYSFNAGGVHFVGLNSVDIDDTRYYGHVDSAQLAWLERDLAVVPPAMPVVTFNHIPFFSSMETVHGLSEAPPAPSVITIGGKAQFRHTVSNASDVLAKLKNHPYPLALAGHIHVRERLRFEGTPTRFEQSAAIVAPTATAGVMFTSGITVYRITGARIDEGRFVPLDKN